MAAVEKLNNGNILCGDVGTGKSITSLFYWYVYVCRGVLWNGCVLGPMLEPIDLCIITTAKKRDSGDWEKELDRFGYSDWGCGVKVVVDSWNNIQKYLGVRNAFFIFDEQRVTGKGAWVKSFIRITRSNRWILLTATPGDTWLDYIPAFVANGFYRNRSDFLNRHAIYHPYITKFPKIIGYRDSGHLEKLRRKITVLMESEKHTTKYWHDIQIGYDKELYRRIAVDRWDPWKDEPIQDIAGACYLMRKASSSLETTGLANHTPFTLNSRALELCHLICEKHPKLIIFYNFDYELNAMKEAFEKCNGELGLYSGTRRFSVAEWNGHKHEDIPKADSWAYLVQYNSGAEGWNCIETDAMAFYSMNYSYKMMTQAAGRIDRLNTPFEELHYYILKSDSPIDKAVEKALSEKRIFNETLFWRDSQ